MCHVLSCGPRKVSWDVMFVMPLLKLCRSVPAYRSSVAFRSAPSRPRRRRTLFARISCVRARARPRASCAGAVRAPDCARETEGAPHPSAPAGAFFRPQPHPAQKGERRPRKPPLCHHCSTFFQNASSFQNYFLKTEHDIASGQRRSGEAAGADPIGYHRSTGGADRERHCKRLRRTDAGTAARGRPGVPVETTGRLCETDASHTAAIACP